jgi:hypothetical protein
MDETYFYPSSEPLRCGDNIKIVHRGVFHEQPHASDEEAAS